MLPGGKRREGGVGGGILPSNVVHGTCTAGGVYPRRVKAGEKKESKKRATPLSSLLLSRLSRGGAASGASADRHRRGQHKPPVPLLQRDAWQLLQRTRSRVYARLSDFVRPAYEPQVCARARDCFACAPRVTRPRGTAERERFRGLVQRLCAS